MKTLVKSNETKRFAYVIINGKEEKWEIKQLKFASFQIRKLETFHGKTRERREWSGGMCRDYSRDRYYRPNHLRICTGEYIRVSPEIFEFYKKSVWKELKREQRHPNQGESLERKSTRLSDPLAYVLEKERAAIYKAVFDQIDQKYFFPWRETKLEGRTQTEVAAELGISVATCGRRIKRAQELIAEKLLKSY